MTPTRDDLQFAAETSCRYHRRRAGFLARFDAVVNWLTLLVTCVGFLSLAGGSSSTIATYATAVVGLLTVTQIGFGVGKAASKHELWHKRWCDLLVAIQTTPFPKPSKMNMWLTERKAIESEYPHELRALEVDCRNQALRALDLDPGEVRIIRWYQRPLLQLFSLQQNYPKRGSVS
jgi:hypothetical protein